MEANKPQDSSTMLHTNRRVTPIEGGCYQKIGEIWTLKHDISAPKLYELLINNNMKEKTVLDINNFYNHIKMCLNAVEIV